MPSFDAGHVTRWGEIKRLHGQHKDDDWAKKQTAEAVLNPKEASNGRREQPGWSVSSGNTEDSWESTKSTFEYSKRIVDDLLNPNK